MLVFLINPANAVARRTQFAHVSVHAKEDCCSYESKLNNEGEDVGRGDHDGVAEHGRVVPVAHVDLVGMRHI
jgi:hypothetical protein